MTDLGVEKVVETGVYVKDLNRAEAFYREVLGLETVGKEGGRHVFLKAGNSMLLLFRAETTLKEKRLPAHGASGVQHFALQVRMESMEAWRGRLKQRGVPVEFETDWPAGGHSLYFRDPDGNSVELVTPGVWPLDE